MWTKINEMKPQKETAGEEKKKNKTAKHLENH